MGSPTGRQTLRRAAFISTQRRTTMRQRLLIIGAGFAGMYAALSAARLRDAEGVPSGELEIALVAPEPRLVIRPRLYEPNPETLTAPLDEVFKAIDVVYLQGNVETIDTSVRTAEILGADGARSTV